MKDVTIFGRWIIRVTFERVPSKPKIETQKKVKTRSRKESLKEVFSVLLTLAATMLTLKVTFHEIPGHYIKTIPDYLSLLFWYEIVIFITGVVLFWLRSFVFLVDQGIPWTIFFVLEIGILGYLFLKITGI